MPKQIGPFLPYAVGDPPKLEFWCSPSFRDEVRALFHRHPEYRDQLANINALVHRLAGGQHLSTTSFRKEGSAGYAFRAGRWRFYGAYSQLRIGAFVLSHPVLKDQQKLSSADESRIKRCGAAFDKAVKEMKS